VLSAQSNRFTNTTKNLVAKRKLEPKIIPQMCTNKRLNHGWAGASGPPIENTFVLVNSGDDTVNVWSV
jgi:hypothetical protein